MVWAIGTTRRRSAAVWRDGWLYTGDIVGGDGEDGLFLFMNEDVIKPGRRLYPREEEILVSASHKVSAVVVGTRSRSGESVAPIRHVSDRMT